ncbi:MAG: Ig-like domain-containing protein [Gemmatimonas sp.]
MLRTLALAGVTLSCGGGSSPTDTPVVTPVLTSIAVTATSGTLPVGGTLQLTATPRDQLGHVMTATLTWTSSTSAVATVSSFGIVSGVSAGVATIQAASGSISGSIAVTVSAPISYVAGQSYFGRNGFIEYVAGNAPVILTAPHGGSLTPSGIPDRTASACGGAATTVTDTNTGELVRAMQQRFFARFGTYPHIIISLLSRRKLDPNRVSPEADCGNADAAAALEDWHAFINTAKTAVLQTSGKGWYMDIHGHGHAIARLELGYLLTDADLNRTDAALDASASFENLSSIRTLSQVSPLSFPALLRGPNSLGTLYANNGFPSVPSASDPSPNGADYFNGGDNTMRHSCGSGATALGGTSNGGICGVQIESYFTGVRDNATNRDRFGDATATVLEEYLRVHWALRLAPP